MIKILLSDDKELLFDHYKDSAYPMGIDLHCVTNWEDAQIKLEENWDDYVGLILDGKGQLTGDSSSNDAKHVTKAIGWLKEKRATGQIIPTIVYTGYLDNIDEFLDRNDHILLGMYDKNTVHITDILNMLVNESSNLPENRIKHMHKDIFDLFDDKRLPKNMQQTMIEVINSLSQSTINKTAYNKIRDLIEAMLKMANSIDKAFVPDELIAIHQGGRPNLKFSVRYLTGQEVNLQNGNKLSRVTIMSAHVGWIFSSVVQSTQIFSHNYNEAHYHYAYKSTVFGLLEVLLWYRDYVLKTYKF